MFQGNAFQGDAFQVGAFVATAIEDIPLGGSSYPYHWRKFLDQSQGTPRWQRERERLEELDERIEEVAEAVEASNIDPETIKQAARAVAVAASVLAKPIADLDYAGLSAEIKRAEMALAKVEAALAAYQEDEDDDDIFLLSS